MALPYENPVIAANLHVVLSRAPGLDMSIDALRTAILGTAAVHKSYCSSRKGDSTGANQLMRLANGYRTHAARLLSKACLTADGVQSDSTIAAAAAIALLDVSAKRDVDFLRDSDWVPDPFEWS